MTRFDLDMDGSMEPSEHGSWVRYEDVQRPAERSSRTTKWVGLTDDERNTIVNQAYDDFCSRRVTDTEVEMLKAIEAKLKEKNT